MSGRQSPQAGEQKALLVSILLAHAALVSDRTGRVPLLLLDEAVAHLDPDRRRALFQRLALHDAVTVTVDVPTRSLTCVGAALPPGGLGAAQDNLAWRAAARPTAVCGQAM
jgi:hypothetical protein